MPKTIIRSGSRPAARWSERRVGLFLVWQKFSQRVPRCASALEEFSQERKVLSHLRRATEQMICLHAINH
jgi:hypothetical protein